MVLPVGHLISHRDLLQGRSLVLQLPVDDSIVELDRIASFESSCSQSLRSETQDARCQIFLAGGGIGGILADCRDANGLVDCKINATLKHSLLLFSRTSVVLILDLLSLALV